MDFKPFVKVKILSATENCDTRIEISGRRGQKTEDRDYNLNVWEQSERMAKDYCEEYGIKCDELCYTSVEPGEYIILLG